MAPLIITPIGVFLITVLWHSSHVPPMPAGKIVADALGRALLGTLLTACFLILAS